ncbi:Gfo/Idh/MocA family protein [Tessaracoccus coleopterorum]|uniref:Gfo/Idh/MocA family protein n=1 Tax=Tessaracoccus coleopterorum TaxID=2714950 RepID=UPI0018D399FE|nr:Gfo/Idh/MocA family oxidoreductase [Tessaracoccus coleopterorum]
MGIVGAGRIARRFVREARFVSGVNVEAVWTRDPASARTFAAEFELQWANETYDDLLAHVDAVYIATPHETHVEFATRALEAGVHVLCEKPMALSVADLEDLYALADERSLVLLEAVKTAFAPGFQRMVAIARSGTIGTIRAVDATFTKLIDSGREVESQVGGALSELGTYPFLALVKLLGTDPVDVSTRAVRSEAGVDLFARVNLVYPHAVASATVGIGVKSEGDLVVSGTRGYLYVPAPWWLTEYFETRFEDPRNNRKYYTPFDGDGLRYELAEFVSMITDGNRDSFQLRRADSLAIASLLAGQGATRRN